MESRSANSPKRDWEEIAESEMKRYCKEHPRSPTARRKPKLFFRGDTCIALLGNTLRDGVAGLGATIEAALRAFDSQYLASSKTPRR